jgi:NAD(P)-dependent dehydrogenase (short-subunit alcohol dehydrogenase family)
MVTAGGSGIGLAVAREIALRGGTPVVIDPGLSAGSLPSDWLAYASDAADPVTVNTIAKDLLATDLPVLGLVNNAGIAGPTALLEDTTLAEWDRVVRVNLLAAVNCMQSIIPIMKRQRQGAVVMVSSAATTNGFPLRSPYVATKAALEALSGTMAMELGPWGIRSNVVLPGIVAGDRVEAIIASQAARRGLDLDAARQEFTSRTSMKTMVEGADIAEAICFLLSDRARFISGQQIGVCGNFEGYSSEMITHLAEEVPHAQV